MKNTAKLSLLLLLGAAQQSLEASKPTASKMTDAKMEPAKEQRIKKANSKPTAIEKEKKRLIYRSIIKAQKNDDTVGLPQLELEWSSLPAVKNITEAQVSQARHEYEMQKEPVRGLLKERKEFLSDKCEPYKQLQDKIADIRNHCEMHKEELDEALHDNKYTAKIIAAEDKAQPYFWKYWQLQNQYDREHPEFLPLIHRPYAQERRLTPEEIEKMALHAEKIDLAPGGKSLELPMLGANQPERIIKYSLTFSDGKMVSGNTAALRTKKITNNTANKKLGRATDTTHETMITIPKHAAPATFYVLEHHLNGDVSVYATVRITKGEDSVMPAPKKAATSKPTKAVRTGTVRRETPPAPLVVPVKAKHTSGKKAVAPAPAMKTGATASSMKNMKKNNSMDN